jgi:hypothetical protein
MRSPTRITSHRTPAYGLWQTTMRTTDGRVWTGSGLSETEALYRARLTARAATTDQERPRKASRRT